MGIKLTETMRKKAFKHLDSLSERFNTQVGHAFTVQDNKSVQGLIERLKLLSIALAECSPAALNNITKKYNKAKRAQGGLKHIRDIPK